MFEKLKTLFNNETVIQKTRNANNKIIEEIHETFYTEVDRLLVDAKNYNSIDTDKQDLINKSNRLKALGFINTKEVQEAKLEISRLNTAKEINKNKTNVATAINYFSFKYPNYKFITEESVKKICNKYNLVYGEINKYIGTVPDVNLKHIEDFKIDKIDCCYIYHESYPNNNPTYCGVSDVKETLNGFSENQIANGIKTYRYDYRVFVEMARLEIVAPQKDFNMRNMEVVNGKITKIEIPDPIVLKPVFYNGNKYYLIVTMWGLEASDELVVNPRHN